MIDRQKVIKGLHCCSHTDGVNCIYCPYDISDTDCTALMAMDVLALLKEQEAVVHCGDCENFCFDVISQNAGHCVLTNEIHSKNWFCAHGKREEGD